MEQKTETRGVKKGTKRGPYTTKKSTYRTPKLGTTEWELWRLEAGRTYTVTRYLHVDEATEDKLKKLKNSMRAQISNYFKQLRSEIYKKDFTVSVYDIFDTNRNAFVVFCVVTAIEWKGAQ
jgi:hypothetical protein|nr:MAG TPA: hypothetical protein [Caudoviricetes sp.]